MSAPERGENSSTFIYGNSASGRKTAGVKYPGVFGISVRVLKDFPE